MKQSLLILGCCLFLTGCSLLQPVLQIEENSVEVGGACTADEECATPMAYLIQSNCPFGAACIDQTCQVVCPLIDHMPTGDQCSSDDECDCTARGGISLDCRCHEGTCVSVEARELADVPELQQPEQQAIVPENEGDELPTRAPHPILDQLRLPAGFQIDIVAEVPNARSMAVVEDTNSLVIFVGNRKASSVYAVLDTDKDYKSDEVRELFAGLNSPNGVAYRDGDLYIAEINRILVVRDVLNNLDAPTYEVLFDDLPSDASHGWKYIAFGPDGDLYIPIGAPCNICDAGQPYASLYKLNLETNQLTLVAQGIRNTVGFDRHPETGALRFTDNGRDWFGNDLPPDELNEITQLGQHFGYPFCHGGEYQDDGFTSRGCDEFVPPVAQLGPHVAALGVQIYDGLQFPDTYQYTAFIAEHGSWNRTPATGYRITTVELETGLYETFIDGRLQPDGSVLGRPVDLVQLDDGSLLISDDEADLIYRVWWTGS